MKQQDMNLTAELKKYFGFDKFKGDQEAIVQNLLAGNDTFVLMPTGGGKSLCYQLPSLLMEGTAIVISPLIALMKNQVDFMNGLSEVEGVAHYLNSSLNKAAIDRVKSDILSGHTKLLYVAPESLTKEDNVEFLKSVKISFYAVDEAHCISEWGHDFRPEYRRIRPIVNEIGNAPVIALTATATDKVRTDIKKNLGIVDAKEFKSSFNRPNLYYEVRPKTKDVDKDIIKFIRQHPGKSGIIYCLSRKKVEELAAILKTNDIKAAAYHAGLDSATRSQTQDDFLMERIDVIVATIAFGMGIDKPDVRLVIHKNSPASLEAYFQEAGRAGRDGKKAYAVMLYNDDDRKRLLMQLRHSFPEKDFIRQVYNELAYFYQIAVGDGYNCNFEFDINKFCRTYRHMPEDTLSAIKILMQSGYVAYTENDDYASRVMFALERDDLYRLRNNSQKEDLLIETMLRKYPGLFCTWTFINEADLASILGMEQREVYLLLKGLDDKNILNYIPQKHIPHLRFTQRREDGHRIIIPKEVYEVMYMKAAERIDAVLKYAQDASTCRSRQLLAYFGETKKEDCGVCDVCSAKKPQEKKTEKWMEAYDMVMAKLADKKRHDIAELCDTDIPLETVADVITYLTHQQTIGNDGIYVFMK